MRAAPEVRAAVSGKAHLLDYVVPTEMYISEIPMYLPPGQVFGHTVNKTPLVEVHLDLNAEAVTATFPPLAEPFSDNRQVPFF